MYIQVLDQRGEEKVIKKNKSQNSCSRDWYTV